MGLHNVNVALDGLDFPELLFGNGNAELAAANDEEVHRAPKYCTYKQYFIRWRLMKSLADRWSYAYQLTGREGRCAEGSANTVAYTTSSIR